MDKFRDFRTNALIASLVTLLIALGVTVAGAQNVDTPAAAGTAKAAAAKPANADDIKVTFDEKDPSIMYVESNGERVRVNTVTKAIERLTPAAEPAGSNAAPSATATAKIAGQEEQKEDLYVYEPGDEPYDYRLVNVPTAKKVPKGTWNMHFTHRFSQPLHPLADSGRALLGLDSFSTSSFGISYGITDKLYLNAYRSPLCQRGLCRTIEIGLGYHVTDQTKKAPVALNVYASVEGNENFTKEYTYNIQAMITRNIGNRVFLNFAPAFHFNSNGQGRFNPRPEQFYPPAYVADSFRLPANGASFGMGVAVRVTPNVMGIFEFTPRTGFKLGRVDPVFDSNFEVVGFKNYSQPEMGIGAMYTIGKHSFTLTLSNTQTTTTARYNSSNLVLSPRRLIIGFNLFRRW